jgi:ornithine carbamoyltransferase
MKRDFISLEGFSKEEIIEIFDLSSWLKDQPRPDYRPLAGKTAALIFEKPSLRTHVSFQVGISQLGGDAIFLSQDNIGLSMRESVRDAAEVLSRYNDLIVARTMGHRTVEELAAHSTVPVINALTDRLHPCQILADAFTLRERGLLTEGTKIAFIGDGNNVVNSWLELAGRIPIHFVLACPEHYTPDPDILMAAKAAGISRIEIIHDAYAAAENADVLYTDVWVSMGQEGERLAREAAFKNYQVNANLLRAASPRCVVMHCLPAHRGEEITADALEGERSIVMDQAENRLHVQKAIIAYLFGKGQRARVEQRTFSRVLA